MIPVVKQPQHNLTHQNKINNYNTSCKNILHVGRPTLRYNPWVHKGGQGKICYDKEGYDSLVRRNPWVLRHVILSPTKNERRLILAT